MDHPKYLIAIVSGFISLITVFAVAAGVYQTTFSRASEASTRMVNQELRHRDDLRPSQEIELQKDATLIEKSNISNESLGAFVSSDQCSNVNGFCTSQENCAAEGGYDTKANCSGGGSYNLTCCVPRSPAPDENRLILEDQCTSTFGGKCMSGNECSAQGGRSTGTCWDGFITTTGVCCLNQNTNSPLARVRDPLSCENTGRIGDPNQPIFCRDCSLKYCANYVGDIDEVAEKCSSPIGRTVARECCYDRDLDNVCDPEPPGYCCKAVNRLP